jgi:tRNA nucleotidyltransferase/poly(A) polymerase
MEDIKKEILKAKEQGNSALVQRLQQELDVLEQIHQNLDWDRYEKELNTLRKLEDKTDKEDFPDESEN